MYWNIPFPPITRFIAAKNTLRKYQKAVLTELLEKHRARSFFNDSFGKLFMEFAEKEQLTEDQMLSELFLFIVAGKLCRQMIDQVQMVP